MEIFIEVLAKIIRLFFLIESYYNGFKFLYTDSDNKREYGVKAILYGIWGVLCIV